MDKKKLEEELEKRLSDRGLLRYAWDYYKAFKEILEKHPRDNEMYQVKFYLLCHSLELVLKAYLRNKGYTRKQLLVLGHNLDSIIREVYKHNLILDKHSVQRISQVNVYYNTKQFEYSQSGYKELVGIHKLADITELILTNIEIHLRGGLMRMMKNKKQKSIR